MISFSKCNFIRKFWCIFIIVFLWWVTYAWWERWVSEILNCYEQWVGFLLCSTWNLTLSELTPVAHIFQSHAFLSSIWRSLCTRHASCTVLHGLSTCMLRTVVCSSVHMHPSHNGYIMSENLQWVVCQAESLSLVIQVCGVTTLSWRTKSHWHFYILPFSELGKKHESFKYRVPWSWTLNLLWLLRYLLRCSKTMQ